MNGVYHWLSASIIFFVIELLPPVTHFHFLCLSIGALAAAIAAAYSALVWLPWVFFILSSAALLPVLVPMAKFLFPPRE